jgi:WD repeat-containing protein 48
MPTTVLGQDEVDCFSAWVSAEAGLGHIEPGSDPKVNYGSLLLQALLEYWTPPIAADLENDIRGNEYFKVPKHTPILFR